MRLSISTFFGGWQGPPCNLLPFSRIQFAENLLRLAGSVIFMCTLRSLALGVIASLLLPALLFFAQSKKPGQAGRSRATFRVTINLVFLDVTVLNKQGQPVVFGLTRKDFQITEDRKPQQISSFEAPHVHMTRPNASENNPNGKIPVTILVLDLLNSSIRNFAYIRYEARRFLMRQPALLPAAVELMVLGNHSLAMLQGYTRDRDELVRAMNGIPATIPYKYMNGFFAWERFTQSIDALQQIALQNKGVPGHKNVIWVGHGGPDIYLDVPDVPAELSDQLREYAHETINMLVHSRITLYVIYPGLKANHPAMTVSSGDAVVDLGGDDPFSGNVNFGLFVNTTGGRLFFNENDIARLMSRASELGSEYYTLTYQPVGNINDGKFRRIRVTVDNRNYHVITKAGYYAPVPNMPVSHRQKMMNDIVDAANSTLPFTALHVSIKSLVRHPDTGTVDMVIQLQDRNLNWLAGSNGRSQAEVLLGAFSLTNGGRIVASRLIPFILSMALQSGSARDAVVSRMPIAVHFPRQTRKVRVVVESEDGGRLGTVDLPREAIEAAPAEPTPPPQLLQRRPIRVAPGY
jgi:VWFA-related protein